MSLNIPCLQYHIVQDTKLAGGRYKKQIQSKRELPSHAVLVYSEQIKLASNLSQQSRASRDSADIGQEGQTWPFTAHLRFSDCIIDENINYKWETCRVQTDSSEQRRNARRRNAIRRRALLATERGSVLEGGYRHRSPFRPASFALAPKRKELIGFLVLPGTFSPGRGLSVRPPLQSPLTALRFVPDISVSGRIFSLHSFSFNRCQDLNWSKYKDAFIPKLSLSQP